MLRSQFFHLSININDEDCYIQFSKKAFSDGREGLLLEPIFRQSSCENKLFLHIIVLYWQRNETSAETDTTNKVVHTF